MGGRSACHGLAERDRGLLHHLVDRAVHGSALGVEPIGNDDVAKGHAAGAPKRPRLWIKAAATSVVAAVFWLIVYVIIETGAISMRAG